MCEAEGSTYKGDGAAPLLRWKFKRIWRVAYIRLVFEDGTCRVAFLASKPRGAKPGTTIPRLERQAAMLAARMCKH